MGIIRTLQDIEGLLADFKRAHLREAGWRYVCDSPGSYWYWWIEHNGKRWTCWTVDEAIGMQGRIEEMVNG